MIYIVKPDRVTYEPPTAQDAWLPEQDYRDRLEEIAKQAFATWEALMNMGPTASQKVHLDRLELRLRLLERPK